MPGQGGGEGAMKGLSVEEDLKGEGEREGVWVWEGESRVVGRWVDGGSWW